METNWLVAFSVLNQLLSNVFQAQTSHHPVSFTLKKRSTGVPLFIGFTGAAYLDQPLPSQIVRIVQY